MTAGAYGSMRATDADREKVRTALEDAHATGRLTWDEFDSRSSALLRARTYAELAPLTADLPAQVPTSPAIAYPGLPGAPQATHPLAITSLACGVAQIAFGPLTGIPAIVTGHIARRQIRRTGQDGAGMALAGMLLGYAGLAVVIAITVALVSAGLWFARHL